jgi:hypothetical protein
VSEHFPAAWVGQRGKGGWAEVIARADLSLLQLWMWEDTAVIIATTTVPY